MDLTNELRNGKLRILRISISHFLQFSSLAVTCGAGQGIRLPQRDFMVLVVLLGYLSVWLLLTN